jgi:hypothetical protein
MRAGRAAVLLVAAGALVMSNVGTATAAGPSARQSVRLSVDRTTCLATLAMSWGNTTTSNVAFVVEDVSTPQGLVHVLSGVPFSGKATATFQGVATPDGTKQDVQGLLQKGGYPAVTDVKTVACHGPWTYRDDWTVR